MRHKSFDKSLLENFNCPEEKFAGHKDIAGKLACRNPYTITILIENLDPGLWRKKDYTKQIKTERKSRYVEGILKELFDEYGDRRGNELYGEWLAKYRPAIEKSLDIDDYIFKHELEPRYKKKVLHALKQYKDIHKQRYLVSFERYYRLPDPLDYIDWRTPYDNIFVWEKNGKKYFERGG